jgi:hypothetical protein
MQMEQRNSLFFVQEFDWGNKKTISYRGTDNPAVFDTASRAGDCWNATAADLG